MALIADRAADSKRDFLSTHPWITFQLDVKGIDWRFWELLGEARSKCRHLAFTPLPPGLAERLSALYLAKGARATTAIEGNTLSEEQALDAVQGQLQLPESQEYLGREIENVLAVCGEIEREILAGEPPFSITVERLCRLNGQVLEGLEVEEHVVPGRIRESSVVVGGVYRAPVWHDCEFLVELLCDWLNGPDFAPVPDDRKETFSRVLLRAAVAHVYIAWIHPFGDGNGRTARLLEFEILTAAGIPSVAAHLLSNHYNATREMYYRRLDHASKSGGDLHRFLVYVAQGFVDELQQQLDEVHKLNFGTAWKSYVDELFRGEDTPAPRRQRQLVLALPAETWIERASIPTLNADLALAYADKGSKTITRDVNALVERGLIDRNSRGAIRTRTEIMFGFLPQLAAPPIIF